METVPKLSKQPITALKQFKTTSKLLEQLKSFKTAQNGFWNYLNGSDGSNTLWNCFFPSSPLFPHLPFSPALILPFFFLFIIISSKRTPFFITVSYRNSRICRVAGCVLIPTDSKPIQLKIYETVVSDFYPRRFQSNITRDIYSSIVIHKRKLPYDNSK